MTSYLRGDFIMKFINKTLLLSGVYAMFGYFRLDFSFILVISVALVVFSLPNGKGEFMDMG